MHEYDFIGWTETLIFMRHKNHVSDVKIMAIVSISTMTFELEHISFCIGPLYRDRIRSNIKTISTIKSKMH